MFWRLPFRPTSSLDATISKDDVTLFNVLDDEDIIQEGKTQNPKLCDFLTIPENLLALLQLITTLPSDELEEKIRYKYPNIACELLCSNMGNISDILVNEHFVRLTSFLNVTPPLNPLFSSLNCKVLNFLCKNKHNEFFSNIRLQSNILPGLLRHIGTSSCMDLILQFVATAEHQEQDFIRWLDDNTLIQSLVSLIRSTSSPDVCFNASQLLVEIQHIERECCIDNIESSILTQVMESQEVVESILTNVFLNEDGPSRNIHLQCCISILQGLLQPVRSLDQMIYPDLSLPIRLASSNVNSCSSVEGIGSSTKEMPLSLGGIKVLNLISLHLLNFHALLNESPDILFNDAPVLGYRRLVIIRLLTAILHVTPPQLQGRFVSSGILKTLLNLFLNFPSNNFLHGQVENIIKVLLSPFIACGEGVSSDSITTTSKLNIQGAESSTKMFKLFLVESQIIEIVLKCWEVNKASQLSNGRRMGYMGHLTNITNKITEIIQSDQDLKNIFTDCIPMEICNEWNQLISEDLPELNLKNESKMGGDSIVSSFVPPDVDVLTNPVLNQAYTEYQLYAVATNFEDGFGVDDECIYEEVISNPFSELDSFDLSLNSNEDRTIVEAFLDMCNDTINVFNESVPILGFDDSNQSSQSDDWISHPIETNFNSSNSIRISDIDSDEDDDEEDHDSLTPEKIKSSIQDSNDLIESHIIYTQTPSNVQSTLLQSETVSPDSDLKNSSLNWPLGDEAATNTWAEFGPFSNISSDVKSQEISCSNFDTLDNITEINETELQDNSNHLEIGDSFHTLRIDNSIQGDKLDCIENQSIVSLPHQKYEKLNILLDPDTRDEGNHNIGSTTDTSNGDSQDETLNSEFFNLNSNNNINCTELFDDLNFRNYDNCLEENYSFLSALGLIHDHSSASDLTMTEPFSLHDRLSRPPISTHQAINNGSLIPLNSMNPDIVNAATSSDPLLSIEESRELAFQAHNDYLIGTEQSNIPKST